MLKDKFKAMFSSPQIPKETTVDPTLFGRDYGIIDSAYTATLSANAIAKEMARKQDELRRQAEMEAISKKKSLKVCYALPVGTRPEDLSQAEKDSIKRKLMDEIGREVLNDYLTLTENKGRISFEVDVWIMEP